ncbi:MAG: hypothetical protein LBH49_00290 [Puniceicoccales bacterium]|jgi:ADP-heptose:LPS heptosyltransferase/lauroyl/myristoyl acyltransferase|nr:hypothetical protein [Puniceicoccales bacterium]
MIVRFLLGFAGILFAHLPRWFVSYICSICGGLLYYFHPSRRKILLSNLDHAFPKKSFQWKKSIARTSCARTVELGLLSITIPWFSRQKLKKFFSVDASVDALISDAENYSSKKNTAKIILVPHFSSMEAMTTLPVHLSNIKFSKIGVIYRPFSHVDVEAYIKHARGKFGFALLSRKNGLLAAKKILKNRGILALLFDQNAGKNGLLTTFFGRIASTTGLPDIFRTKFNTKVFVLFSKRIGFWKSISSFQQLELQGDSKYSVAFAMNRWLEKTLSSSDEVCADWLWMHNRWHCQDDANTFLHISAKRIDDLHLMEKKTRIFLRLPNWLGDVLMVLPVIKAISCSRKDACVTIIAKAQFCELLKYLCIGDNHIPLPKKNFLYFYRIFQHRRLFPDFYILLTNSFRGDLEAKIIGCAKTFGMVVGGGFRPLLTDGWKVPESLSSARVHQRLVIQKFFEAMGLNAHMDLAPWRNKPEKDKKIALICGSENFPAKRWPVQKWCKLVDVLLEKYCGYEILLIGTDADGQIAGAIKNDFQKNRAVTNLAGKTSLTECLEILAACAVAVGNDTGGIHLANMAGCPVVVVYGPTNPLRTGPIFASPIKILKKSEDLVISADISTVDVSDVVAAVEDVIHKWQ